MNYVTLVVELPEGEKPAIKPFMEVLGGKVTAVAWKDALDELERLEDCDVDCDDDCGGTGVGGIGSVSTTDFRYAKMQTVHQLLVNTVSRPTETTENAIELARMVDAAFSEIDAPIQENPVASSGGEYSEKYTDSSGVLAWLKQGKRVARAGWNGEGQFAWLVPEGKYPARMEAIKGFYPDDVVPYAPYFALKNAQGQVVPWIPSVGDLLATDWYVVS